MKVVKNIFTVLFTILFSIFIVLNICVFCVSDFAVKDNIVESIKKMDISKEVNKIRNSGNGSGKLSGAINDMYLLASQFSVSEKVVDQIIDSNATKEIIGKATGNLTDYVVNGKDTKIISADDAYDIISDNLDEWLEDSGVSITDSQKEKFLREVEKQLPDIAEFIPSSEDLLGTEYEDKIKLIQKIFSKQTKIICIVGLIVSGIMVIILKGKYFTLNLGIASLISGLVTVGLSFVLPELIVSMMNEADLSLIASSISNELAKSLLYFGFIPIIVSIILLIIYKITKKKN